MHEYNSVVFLQYNIRPPWQALRMETKAVSIAMENAAYKQLGFGVFTAHTSHIPGALFLGKKVHLIDPLHGIKA